MKTETYETAAGLKRIITVIDRVPTLADPDGSYKFVDAKGIYWGHWYVGTNWHGARFVCEAASDGIPL